MGFILAIEAEVWNYQVAHGEFLKNYNFPYFIEEKFEMSVASTFQFDAEFTEI